MTKRNAALRRHGSVLGLTALLAACGGGGGSGGALGIGGGTGTGGGGGVTATGNPVYATPSGSTCDFSATVSSCTAPTSSQVNFDQLFAGLKDPQGPSYRFDAFGFQWDVFTTLSAARFVSGVAGYAMVEEPLIVGRNQVKDANTTYTFSRDVDIHDVEFAGDGKTFDVGLSAGGGSLSTRRHEEYEDSVIGPPETAHGNNGNRVWTANIGLLTDTIDAPTDKVLTYSGAIYVFSGDASPNSEGTSSKIATGGCPITLTLDSVDGTLATSSVSCTHPQTAAILQFSLANLFFKGARLWSPIGSEATIHFDGPIAGNPVLGQVTTDFSSSSIAGALYGPGAKVVVVSGAGTLGGFQIVATRP